MKKVLFLMGAFLAFAACEQKADCDCTISGDMTNVPLFTEEQATLVEFQGTCDQATWTDLSEELQTNWLDENGDPGNLTLSCVER
jgi:hypothetical protein